MLRVNMCNPDDCLLAISQNNTTNLSLMILQKWVMRIALNCVCKHNRADLTVRENPIAATDTGFRRKSPVLVCRNFVDDFENIDAGLLGSDRTPTVSPFAHQRHENRFLHAIRTRCLRASVSLWFKPPRSSATSPQSSQCPGRRRCKPWPAHTSSFYAAVRRAM